MNLTNLPLAHIYATAVAKSGYISAIGLKRDGWQLHLGKCLCIFYSCSQVTTHPWKASPASSSPAPNFAWVLPCQDGVKKQPLSYWLPIFAVKVKANENRHCGRWRRSSKIESRAPACSVHFVTCSSTSRKKKMEGKLEREMPA